MLKLDVPFVPDEEYVDFLARNVERLTSVHFSLYDPTLCDARQRMEAHKPQSIIAGLNKLGSTQRFVLLNSRLHDPQRYFDAKHLTQATDRLTMLADEAGIEGLIFGDPYYLQALGSHAPKLAARLEAVPTVNAQLDSPGRVYAMLEMIRDTPFRPPSKLVLDRNLNRDFDRLEATVNALRRSLPDIRLHLIANEGCLHHCPYKPTHNAHISMVNQKLCDDRTFAINREYGCIRRFLQHPESFLVSPFIRPEDMDHYAPYVDGIKLCGRNKGTKFLMNAFSAYANGQYEGNLLDIMDAMGDLSGHVHIHNERIPDDFVHRVGRCNSNCTECRYCSDIAKTAVKRLDVQIPDM